MKITLKKINSGAITQKLGTNGFTPVITTGGYNFYRSSNGYEVLEEMYKDTENIFYVVKGLKNDSNARLDFEGSIDWGVVEAREEEARKKYISEVMKENIKKEILYMAQNKDLLTGFIEEYKEEGLSDLNAFIKTIKNFKRKRSGTNQGWIKIMIKKGYNFENYKTAYELIN